MEHKINQLRIKLAYQLRSIIFPNEIPFIISSLSVDDLQFVYTHIDNIIKILKKQYHNLIRSYFFMDFLQSYKHDVNDIYHVGPNVDYGPNKPQTLFQKLIPIPINNYPKIPIPIKDIEMENMWNDFGEKQAPNYIYKYEPIMQSIHEQSTHEDMNDFEKELYDIWKNTISNVEFSENVEDIPYDEIPSYIEETDLINSLQEIENMTNEEYTGHMIRHQRETEKLERIFMHFQEVEGEVLRNEYEDEQKQLQQKKQEQIRIQQEQKLLELQLKQDHERKIQQDRMNQMNEYSKQFMERKQMTQHEASGTILRNIQKQEHDIMLLHKKNQENERLLLEQRIRQERKDRVQLWNEQFEKQQQDKDLLKQEEIKRKELLRDQSKLAHKEKIRVARLTQQEFMRGAARLEEQESKYDPPMELPPPSPSAIIANIQKYYDDKYRNYDLEKTLYRANLPFSWDPSVIGWAEPSMALTAVNNIPIGRTDIEDLTEDMMSSPYKYLIELNDKEKRRLDSLETLKRIGSSYLIGDPENMHTYAVNANLVKGYEDLLRINQMQKRLNLYILSSDL